MKKLCLLFIVVTGLFSLNTFAKTALKISQGTMQLGGTVHMPIAIPKNGNAEVGLNIAPSWDYFITRSFSLGIAVSVQRDNLAEKDGPWSFAIAARGVFYFDLGGPIYPYIGGGAGVKWISGLQEIYFPILVPVGMLVAVNTNVAIDFGIPIEFILSNDGYKGMLLPIGFIGVRAFF